MLICIILFLALLLPVAFLPLALDTYTPIALDEMGVCLDSPESALEQTDACSQGNEWRSLLNSSTPILCAVKR